MSNISPSRIGEDFPEDFRKAVDACETPDEVAALMRAAAIQVGVVRPDEMNPDILHEVTTPEPQRYAKVLNINGIKHTVEAETEAGLAEAELAVMRQIFGVAPPATEQQTQQTQPEEKPLELIYDPISRNYRDSKGRFVSDDVARNIIDRHEQEANQSYRELQLEQEIKTKLLRGEISLTQAMDQSGVVERAIDRRTQQSWADATARALEVGGPLEEWPGSPDGVLLERLGNRISELGLQDSSDKVSALAQAWQSLQEEDAEQSETDAMVEYQKALEACQSTADIADVQRRFFGNRTVHGMSPDELAARGFWGK